jgi:hypothetical protein
MQLITQGGVSLMLPKELPSSANESYLADSFQERELTGSSLNVTSAIARGEHRRATPAFCPETTLARCVVDGFFVVGSISSGQIHSSICSINQFTVK